MALDFATVGELLVRRLIRNQSSQRVECVCIAVEYAYLDDIYTNSVDSLTHSIGFIHSTARCAVLRTDDTAIEVV
jgi:hypothetical protein